MKSGASVGAAIGDDGATAAFACRIFSDLRLVREGIHDPLLTTLLDVDAANPPQKLIIGGGYAG